MTRTPLIIVAPGSSKTLSLNKLSATMNQLIIQEGSLHVSQPSISAPGDNSTEIEGVFKRGCKSKVFLLLCSDDGEAGLPEESHDKVYCSP